MFYFLRNTLVFNGFVAFFHTFSWKTELFCQNNPFMRRLLLFAFAVTTGLHSYATTYETASSGNWSAPATWVNGLVAPFYGSDSILIRHYVMYTATINLFGPGYIHIDTSGTLCGHRKFFVHTGALVVNYGVVYADSLFVTGGSFQNYGNVYLSQLAVIGNGGSFQNSGSMQVGASFLCSKEPDGIAVSNEDTGPSLFPNPVHAGGNVRFDEDIFFDRLTIVNSAGEKLIDQPIAGNFFCAENLVPGIYFVILSNENKTSFAKLIVID
jgi:hypothetical protein